MDDKSFVVAYVVNSFEVDELLFPNLKSAFRDYFLESDPRAFYIAFADVLDLEAGFFVSILLQ